MVFGDLPDSETIVKMAKSKNGRTVYSFNYIMSTIHICLEAEILVVC